MNVFPVDRRDEGLVELPGNFVRDTVADMFNVFDALCLLNWISEIFRHVFQQATAFDHVVGGILEQIEKRFFPRYEPKHKVLSSGPLNGATAPGSTAPARLSAARCDTSMRRLWAHRMAIGAHPHSPQFSPRAT
ncbi:hypothetical protein NSPZN2_10459 [Nitrospira defluvii]|uniref:Uncharacterized protein n=1 Tax=Nitrospira defluvii TaxID=330214 RepID=A0ABM8QGI9_9BACT|nr:hypothetical protein NSPZN2_10459 [Nitrospira defluvii]